MFMCNYAIIFIDEFYPRCGLYRVSIAFLFEHALDKFVYIVDM